MGALRFLFVASQVAAHGRHRGCLELLGKTLAMALLTGRGEERCPSGCHDPHSPLPLEWADVGEMEEKTSKENNIQQTHVDKIGKTLAFPEPLENSTTSREFC